ncbi:MAG: ABC transporter ATP-binding protein [candidate division GAL15 bacterium]
MLEVRSLEVRYGDFVAVHGISLAVRQGEAVALLGPNGAGKTTVLRAIHGLVPMYSGTLSYKDRSLVGLPTWERVRLGIALVPEGRELFGGMRVEEHLELGFVPGRGRSYDSLRAEVYELFPVLAERRRQVAGTLSGGEQQMLAIARALMSAPELLMLDEPSLGLAPRVVRALYEKLAVLRRRGLTLIVVEQYVHEVLRLADRAYVLEGGRIVLEGGAEGLLRDPRLQRTYLAVS